MTQPPQDQEQAESSDTLVLKSAGKAVSKVTVTPGSKEETALLSMAVRASLVEPSAHELTKLDDMQQAAVDDRKTDTKLKKVYAYWFIGILIGQLLLMNAIFAAVGFNWLEFKDPSHLNLFMGGTLTEVFGVVFVITRYLFSRKDSESGEDRWT